MNDRRTAVTSHRLGAGHGERGGNPERMLAARLPAHIRGKRSLRINPPPYRHQHSLPQQSPQPRPRHPRPRQLPSSNNPRHPPHNAAHPPLTTTTDIAARPGPPA